MKYFLSVARSEHMTRSAEQLHIAQPALSRSIARLERELGVSLFERDGRGIRLTPEGKLLQTRLQKIVAQVDALPAELSALSQQRHDTVRIEVSAASRLAIEAISTWMAQRPDAHIELAQNGKPDAGANVVISSTVPASCAETRCFDERIMVAIPADSDLGDGPVTLDALSTKSFVYLAGSFGFRRVCDDICREYGFKPAISLESDNPDAVRTMIALNLGVGFWPERSWGKPAGSGVRLVGIDAPGFERHLHVSLLSSRMSSPSAAELYDHLCAHIEQEFSETI